MDNAVLGVMEKIDFLLVNLEFLGDDLHCLIPVLVDPIVGFGDGRHITPNHIGMLLDKAGGEIARCIASDGSPNVIVRKQQPQVRVGLQHILGVAA
ncbi:hypothetical protein D3C75_1119110 [compost metagenome]